MRQGNKPTSRRPNIVVIGGGTGLPVILKSLKELNAQLTGIVTVADDGEAVGNCVKLLILYRQVTCGMC